MIPFHPEVYERILAAYNEAMWPAHLIFVLLGAFALVISLRQRWMETRMAPLIMAGVFFWVGYGYYILEFSDLSWAAKIFASLFIAEGLFFLGLSGLGKGLPIGGSSKTAILVAILICTYGVLGHPALVTKGSLNPQSLSSFGVHPLPTLIFTFGLLVLVRGKLKWALLPLPLLATFLVSTLSRAMDHSYDLIVLPIAVLAIILMVAESHKAA